MADNEGKKLRFAVYCRVGRPENLDSHEEEKYWSPAGQGRKGADADADKESCDICKGFNRA